MSDETFQREVTAARSALTRIVDQHRVELGRVVEHGAVLCDYLGSLARGEIRTAKEEQRIRRALEAFKTLRKT